VPLALLGICDRVNRVKIPTSSVYRRLQLGVAGTPETLGEHLRRVRVDRGLTNVQTALMLGVAYQTVERWEHNRRAISAKNRSKVLAFLGFDPDEAGATKQMTPVLGICSWFSDGSPMEWKRKPETDAERTNRRAYAATIVNGRLARQSALHSADYIRSAPFSQKSRRVAEEAPQLQRRVQGDVRLPWMMSFTRCFGTQERKRVRSASAPIGFM
jgi:transcriptional regulator with XRE-family HTH domain